MRKICLLLLLLSSLTLLAQLPIETATKVNAWFMNHVPDPTADTFVRNKKRPSSLWTRAVYYEGLMALYQLNPQPGYRDYTLAWANAHHWTPRNGVTTRDADDYCCCQTYIDMYRLGYGTLDHVIEHANRVVADTTDDAWWWIDAIQMGMPAFYKLTRTTGDSRYADKAWHMYSYTRDKQDGGLRNPVNGLWWRDRDFNPPYTTPSGKECYWSRGDGWVVAALCRVLDEMRPTDPHYQDYVSDLLSLLEGLRPLQREDLFWNCSLADSTDFGGKEVTGTSLFIYGYAWCVNHGLLPYAEYESLIMNTWNAMVRDCVHPDGMLGYQQGTGKEPKDSQPVTYDRLPDFEDYGVGCFLLCATEVHKLQLNKRASAHINAQRANNREAINVTAKAGTRWWWQGSAVDSAGISYQLSELSRAGLGAVEITPIYGVKDNEANDIPYLSPRWMQMLSWCQTEGQRLGVEIEMNNGTGWPFGGPEVTPEYAAKKVVFHEDGDSIWYDVVPTRQKVKRAAPGGEGFVIDHFDRQAVEYYLHKFDTAFAHSGVAWPSVFFNDSYEVYGADWTPDLLPEFEARRGYRLQDYFHAFLHEDDPEHARVIMDYRETLSDLLLENFAEVWVQWCHSHGVLVRNQSHGSPANLLDMYAAVDIPEIEGFGLSDFGIRDLRTDTLTRPNYSDLSMLKYPASVAHFYGKPLVSAETFTWLTEHWRTSLSQCKPDFDLMMTAGVNHCYFHGTCYSPQDAPWPGRLFYAAMEMCPQNTIWHDLPTFTAYIERVQSTLQSGRPDNDLLVYLPVYDLWAEYPGRLLMFDIHKMDKVAPQFIAAVNSIVRAGYDPDYVSDRMIREIVGVDSLGRIIAPSGVTYGALVLPEVKRLPVATAMHLDSLERWGATIIRVAEGEDYAAALAACNRIHPDSLRLLGLSVIRRIDDNNQPFWFVSNLTPNTIETPDFQLFSGESALLSADRFERLSGLRGIYPATMDTLDLTIGNKVGYWSQEYPDSVGTGRYTLRTPLLKKAQGVLYIPEVRESAHVYVNGHDAGVIFAAPFMLDVSPYLKRGRNTIVVDVTSLAANRVAAMDRRGEKWRVFKDANIANLKGGKVSDYSHWDTMPCGLGNRVFLLQKP